MHATHPLRFRPALETLEGRRTPAGTVTGTFAAGTWTLVGDGLDNDISINQTGPGAFSLTGNAGTTPAGQVAPSNVKNIVIKLQDGDDVVKLNDTATPITLTGNLTIQEGNLVTISRLTLGKNLKVTNGGTTALDALTVNDSTISGNAVVSNGDGDSSTFFQRTSAGVSFIDGNLTITSGVGLDLVGVIDHSINGNVVIKNGLPNPALNASKVQIFNAFNTTARSVITGSVTAIFQGGGSVGINGIWDTEVLGNVTFKHGTGTARSDFDGLRVNQPVLIHGSFNIQGTGASTINVGQVVPDYVSFQTGLIVGKNLSVTTGDQGDDLTIHRLRVTGATKINTGGGGDDILINDSLFVGPKPSVSPFGLQLLTGAGDDFVSIEVSSGPAATQFIRAVKIDMGLDNDQLDLGFGSSDTLVQFFGKATALGGAGSDTLNNVNSVSFFGSAFIEDFEL